MCAFNLFLRPNMKAVAVCAIFGFVAAVTCGDVREAYKAETCCGAATKVFDEEKIHAPPTDCQASVWSHLVGKNYGFDLVDLTDAQKDATTCSTKPAIAAGRSTCPMAVPEQECYYPVTLQALIDSGHKNYTWIPQTQTNEHAPDGAYVYQMEGGTFTGVTGTVKYKNIVANPDQWAVAGSPTLKFTCGLTMERPTSFADAAKLGMAEKCRKGPVSIDAAPFTAYQNYMWVQLEGMTCGAYVYEVTAGGPLVYHSCG